MFTISQSCRPETRRVPWQRVAQPANTAIRGPLPMLNAYRGIRGRELMPASSSYTAVTATAMQMWDSAGPPHNESTLRRANAGVFLPSAFRRAHRSLATSARRGPPVVFYYSRRILVTPLPRRARHLMKCHRCPTNCRVKCRRLLIPRLFLQLRGRGISILRDGMRCEWCRVATWTIKLHIREGKRKQFPRATMFRLRSRGVHVKMYILYLILISWKYTAISLSILVS
jgi:hypothetical protein